MTQGFLFYTTHVNDPCRPRLGSRCSRSSRETGSTKPRSARAEPPPGLIALQQEHACIGDVRGRGLMQGIELVVDRRSKTPADELGQRVTRRCFELGLHMNIVQLPGMGAVFRLAPPLTIADDELDLGVTILDEALRTSVN